MKYSQIVRRVACWLGWHRWQIMARSDRHDRLRHLHPLAGCLARCHDCGWFWDDLPGANRRIHPWDGPRGDGEDDSTGG